MISKCLFNETTPFDKSDKLSFGAETNLVLTYHDQRGIIIIRVITLVSSLLSWAKNKVGLGNLCSSDTPCPTFTFIILPPTYNSTLRKGVSDVERTARRILFPR